MVLRIAVVLCLIGMLFFLLLMAIWKTLVGSHSLEPAILSEIDQLHNALQAYKEKHLVYPPCMAEPDLDVRKRQFMEHLHKVYPSSTYGELPADFDKLNNYISANYKVPGGSGTVSLDLNRLDPAEALVFWLGGFPTPVSTRAGGGQPIAPSRLFGFNKDSDSPLKRSLVSEGIDPLGTRTDARFDFRQERLVDIDEDGWWEYVPTPQNNGSALAPYVYFDWATYRRASTSPDGLGTVLYPADPMLADMFGTVVPFAKSYDPSRKDWLQWQNPDSFQIVCGGLDGLYSAPSRISRIEIFPGGESYLGPTFAGPPVECDEMEADNLTNLAHTTLSGDDPGAESSSKQWINLAFVWFLALGTILLAILFLTLLMKPTERKTNGPEPRFPGVPTDGSP